MHRLLEMRPSTVLKLFKQMDAFRKPERVRQFALTCESDSRGRLGLENRDYPQTQLLLDAFAAAQTVRASDVDPRIEGPGIGTAMDRLRTQAIAGVLKTTEPEPDRTDAPVPPEDAGPHA